MSADRVNIFGSYLEASQKWGRNVSPQRKLLAVLSRTPSVRYDSLWRDAYLNENLTAADFTTAFGELRGGGFIAVADDTNDPVVSLTDLGHRVLAIG